MTTTNESYQMYLDNQEVCEICNSHASDLRTIAENRDVFSMLKEDLPQPPKHRKVIKLFKEKLVIILIAFCCAALSIQHIVLTMSAAEANKPVFYAGWQQQDWTVCLLMLIAMGIDYCALQIVRRNERRFEYGT